MTTPQKETDSLPRFTAGQRYDIALSYIKALIGGQVTRQLLTEDEVKAFQQEEHLIVSDSVRQKLPKGFEEKFGKMNPTQLIGAYEEIMDEQMRVILEVIPATEQERHQAVNSLLTTLINERIGGKVKGQFLVEPDIGTRVTELEDKAEHAKELMLELKVMMKALLNTEPKRP